MSTRTVEKPETVVKEVDAKVCEQCGLDETKLDSDDGEMVKSEYYRYNPTGTGSTDWTHLPGEDRYLCPDCTDIDRAHQSLELEKEPDTFVDKLIVSAYQIRSAFRSVASDVVEELVSRISLLMGLSGFSLGMLVFYSMAVLETEFEGGFHTMFLIDATGSALLALIGFSMAMIVGVLLRGVF